jgi:alpha-beta hydrolase superfamily lysophospholipase
LPNNFTLITSDNLQLNGAYFSPFEDIKAAIVLIHGMGEHFGRYKHVVDFFTGIGYAVIGMDYRGHGTSQGKKGHIPSYNQLMDDTDLLVKKAHELFNGLPLIMYGHSLGGNIAANYVLRRQPALKGLIVTAPYFKLAFNPPGWKIALSKIMAKILPALTLPTQLELAALSQDKSVVDAYKNDSLVHDKISATFFINVHPAGLYPIEHAKELKTKTLAMHGLADRITLYQGTTAFAQNNPQMVELKLWDGLYHEIHNEKEKQQVFDYIAGWLKKI